MCLIESPRAEIINQSTYTHRSLMKTNVPLRIMILTTKSVARFGTGLEGPFDQKGKGHRPPHPTGHLMANQLRGKHLQQLPNNHVS